jgi:hypothetical protein
MTPQKGTIEINLLDLAESGAFSDELAASIISMANRIHLTQYQAYETEDGIHIDIPDYKVAADICCFCNKQVILSVDSFRELHNFMLGYLEGIYKALKKVKGES